MDAAEVVAWARENNVKFIRLQFVDLTGSLKNVAVTIEELPRVLASGLPLTTGTVRQELQVPGDAVLVPDPATFVVFPWRPREGAVARLICDLKLPGGEAHPLCSRSACRRAVQRWQGKGFSLSVAALVEFYLLLVDEQQQPLPVPHDQAGICELSPNDRGENARRDMVLTLEEMGIPVALSYHSAGPGQHAILLQPEDPFVMADNLATFRFVVRTIAMRHGLAATFLPRLSQEWPSSGLTLYFALGAKESTYGEGGEECYHQGLKRKWVRQFAAGILQAAAPVAAVANPLVNSYKRLHRRGEEFWLGWSTISSRAWLRLMEEGHNLFGDIAWQSPDTAANPYLLIASALASGCHGIEEELSLPPAEKTLNAAVEEEVPRDLWSAVQALYKSTLLRFWLGDELVNVYVKLKMQEWDEYNNCVHRWEIERYLRWL